MTVTMLLGVEGCNEAAAEHWPYIRRATDDEEEAFYQAHTRKYNVDSIGRPYLVMVVDVDHPNCPEAIRSRLLYDGVLRLLRLRD